MTETVPDVLARIVAHKRELPSPALSVRKRWERQAEQARAGRRDFLRALAARTPAIIAEIKKASPSKGLLAPDFDPARLAREYEAGGAAALSVLTDEAFFQGSLADLAAARGVCGLPVLRKDFTLDENHVLEAAAGGADAILLIAAILEAVEICDLVMLPPYLATPFAMLLHELATNAAKYGALRERGTVSITWRIVLQRRKAIGLHVAGKRRSPRFIERQPRLWDHHHRAGIARGKGRTAV